MCSIDDAREPGRILQHGVLEPFWVLLFIHEFIRSLNVSGDFISVWVLSFSMPHADEDDKLHHVPARGAGVHTHSTQRALPQTAEDLRAQV